jgi:acyl carrier protein
MELPPTDDSSPSTPSDGTPTVPDPTEEAIRAWLIANVADVLELAPQQIDVRQAFDHYGMDSMQAYILSGDLEVWLGRPLSPNVAWDYPTIELLARHLAN